MCGLLQPRGDPIVATESTSSCTCTCTGNCACNCRVVADVVSWPKAGKRVDGREVMGEQHRAREDGGVEFLHVETIFLQTDTLLERSCVG